MLDKENILTKIIPKLKKLYPNEGIILATYKRNRTLTIIFKEESYLFIQKGYENKSYFVKPSQLKKQLKKVLKTEFPRSRKIRVYPLREQDFLQNLKKL
ncbi:hypothetical protein [Desulfonauticus submarinus]|uniref:Uncharacterized protein n=1 Tax=Desulfonauticus submarinus TaxID=206665 RepID=A0A1H0CVN1_9BACT|nr:hypothetical protein SAMN04488516_103208 [Desulfonauticus submarinus]